MEIAGHRSVDLLDIECLRGFDSKPRVHENGFIQIDLDHRARLHVWGDPRIPRQGTWHPVHDHVFGFVSHVLKGRMVNVKHRLTYDREGPYYVYVPQRDNAGGHKSPLVRRDDRRWLTDLYAPTTTHAGSTYPMYPWEFHESMPAEPTVTVIVKDSATFHQNNDGPLPRILVPVGVKPDNFFKRTHDPDLLWGIIADVLR